MSWIDFCNYLFYAIIFTSITGSVFALIWIVLRKTVLRSDCVFVRKLLQIVVHAYMIPVLFPVLLVQYGDDYLKSVGLKSDNLVRKTMFELSPKMQTTITVIMTLWIAGVIITFCYWNRQHWKLHSMLRASVPEDDEEILVRFEEIRKLLGIRKNVQLLRNDMVPMAFTAGVFQKSVVLPFGVYTEEELTIILAHELGHCKQNDLFYKFEAVWANVIHVWNPLVYYVRKCMSELMEYACDVNVCTYCKSLFNAKDYFGVILKETQEVKVLGYLSTALVESESKLRRRVNNMKNYQTKGTLKRGFAALVAGVFLLGGSLTAYAAGNGIVNAQNNLYEETSVKVVGSEAATVEYVVPAEDVEDVPTTIVESAISLRTTIVVDWNVPAGEKYRTTVFKLSSGDQVAISIKSTPSGKNIRVGLIYPNGEEHYVNCTGTVGHTFTVNQTGSFSFFIDNESDVTVRAEGSYVR